MEQVRVGIIGCGGFARGMHIPNLRANPSFQIVATCDVDEGAAHAALADAGALYATTDVDALLGDPDVDAVIITTRHNAHAELSVRAARAGKHILCEKPMGLNMGECRQVAEAVSAAGVAYSVGYNRGMAPLVRAAIAHLRAAPAKQLIYHRIQAPFPASHWTHDPAIGGGRFVGEGCHIFDLLCELVGAPPVSVHAAGGTFLDPARVRIPDSGIVTVTFADGSVGATLIASDGCPAFPKEATEVYWGGRALYLDNYRELAVYDADGLVERQTLPEVDKGHRVELERWADAILAGAPPPNGLEQAMRAALISYKALDALATGQAQPIAASEYAL
ncbi:MAG: Gfo/Idh/MocA family oxidoreductase [Chloroflexota bacterium]